MTIFIGTDHRGFDVKNQLAEYLQNKNIKVDDMGNYVYNADDDYTDFAQKVSHAVMQDTANNLGIVICGSGVGVCIASNKVKGIRCAQGFNIEEIRHARERDHINVLALAADFFGFEEIKTFVDVFIQTQPTHEDRDTRRIKKMETTKI
jgi:ribose 5-phosphate isomerase B